MATDLMATDLMATDLMATDLGYPRRGEILKIILSFWVKPFFRLWNAWLFNYQVLVPLLTR